MPRRNPLLRPLRLTNRLKTWLEGAQRLALLAVGSELRGDDVAGRLVAEYLEQELRHKAKGLRPPSSRILKRQGLGRKPELRIFRGHTAPENCTGGIKKFAPAHLIIVDAAELGRKPGTIAVVEPEQIAGVSFSTHQMPLSVLLDYLKTSFAFNALVIAIQPAHLDYDRPPSLAVRRAARRLAVTLASTL